LCTHFPPREPPTTNMHMGNTPREAREKKYLNRPRLGGAALTF